RLARADDVGSPVARRQDGGGGGGPRHGDPPLSRAPKGQGDLDQPNRLDLRLDARPLVSRQVRQHIRRAEICGTVGEGVRRHGRGRPNDQGPGAAHKSRSDLDDDAAVPGQAGPEPQGSRGRLSLGAGRRRMTKRWLAALAAMLGLTLLVVTPLQAADLENTLYLDLKYGRVVIEMRPD